MTAPHALGSRSLDAVAGVQLGTDRVKRATATPASTRSSAWRPGVGHVPMTAVAGELELPAGRGGAHDEAVHGQTWGRPAPCIAGTARRDVSMPPGGRQRVTFHPSSTRPRPP